MRRAMIVALSVCTAGCQRAPDPEEIRAMLAEAAAGTTIRIPAGTYAFDRPLVLNADGVGVIGAGQDRTVLTFGRQGRAGVAIRVDGKDLRLEGFAIEDAPGDALEIVGAQNVRIQGVRAEWTGGSRTDNGGYGISVADCGNVLIENSAAIGASDAGIRVARSRRVIVRGNVARGNVAGIAIESSADVDVHNNVVTANTGGILVYRLPGEGEHAGGGARVFRNAITANNTANFASPARRVAGLPAGTGIMISANRDVQVFENTVTGNATANVLVLSYLITGNAVADASYDPYPERVSVHDNVLSDGGAAPDSAPLKRLIAGVRSSVPDIVWDGFSDGGADSALCLRGNGAASFVNLNAPNDFTASFDPTPHDCEVDALPAVVWAE